MRFGLFLGSLILVMSVISSCNYRVEKTVGGEQSRRITKAELDQVSYAMVYDWVFAPKCVECHANKGKMGFDYDSAVKKLGAIKSTTLDLKTMPENGSLTSDEISVLAAWISAGGPREAGEPPVVKPTPTPAPLVPTFASIKENIFKARCVSCHSIGGDPDAEGVPLDTIADLVDSPRDLVIPGNPDESGLVLSIERNDKKRMPPLDKGPPLTDDEKRVIREWIQNGAKD